MNAGRNVQGMTAAVKKISKPLAALALGIFLQPSFAHALSDYNPTGVYGMQIRLWKASWSEAFFKCLNNEPRAKNLLAHIQKGRLKDVGKGKQWCPTGDLSTEANAKLFYLSIFKALAKPESDYNERSVNPDASTGTAYGLFQMGDHDARAHGCRTPSGKKIQSGDELRKGENNICCALKIAANVASLDIHKQAGNQNYLATGSKGLLGAFWEPVRSFSSHKKPIIAKVNAVCSQLGKPAVTKTFSIAELAAAGIKAPQPPMTPANPQSPPKTVARAYSLIEA